MRFRIFTGGSFCVVWFIFQLIAFRDVSAAEDSENYSFDTGALAVNPLDAAAGIEFYPSLFLYGRDVPLSNLKFGNQDKTYDDAYNLKTEAYVQYQRSPFLAFTSGALYGSYFRRPDSLGHDEKLFEGYLKYSPDASLSLLAGKRLFQWGKGYSFNPVSFAGRRKDISDIDATLEGYWNVSLDYVKSFNSPLSTVALNAVLLPVYGGVNKDYLPDKSLAGLIRVYLLLWNTDFDFYFFSGSGKNQKAGLDFSRNVLSHCEIHGEWAFMRQSSSTTFSDEASPAARRRPANNLVAGARYLTPFNTTFILEYLHIGSGFSGEDMDAFWRAMDGAIASSDPVKKQSFLRSSSQYFNSQFVMTDYLFFKATQPDPFNFVYFTPSVYAIANVLDRSVMAGMEATYNRSRHLLLTGRYVAFLGHKYSEYGAKPARHRMELRLKWSF
jgi:hypothetical protein